MQERVKKTGFEKSLAKFERRDEVKDTAAQALRELHFSELENVTLREQNKRLSEGKSLSVLGLKLGTEGLVMLIGAIIALSIISFNLLYLVALIILYGFRIYFAIEIGKVKL